MQKMTSRVDIENYITFLKENFNDDQKNVPKGQKRQKRERINDYIARMRWDYIQRKKEER